VILTTRVPKYDPCSSGWPQVFGDQRHCWIVPHWRSRTSNLGCTEPGPWARWQHQRHPHGRPVYGCDSGRESPAETLPTASPSQAAAARVAASGSSPTGRLARRPAGMWRRAGTAAGRRKPGKRPAPATGPDVVRALGGHSAREGTTRVTWDIEPVGNACCLTVAHDQLREDAHPHRYGAGRCCCPA